jgi:hypothetical protein
MNCQENQSPTTEGLVNPSARDTPPPAFPPLSWIHVIHEPDRETQELDADHALSAADQESALLRQAEQPTC